MPTPLLVRDEPTTDGGIVYCDAHGHEAELTHDDRYGWLLSGAEPKDGDDSGLIFDCPGVLGRGSDADPCDDTIIFTYATA